MRLLARIAVLLVSVGACCQSAVARTPHQVRLGSAPQTPHGATVVGALPDTTKLSAVVELKPSDPLALSNYAQSVSTPGSADYHQYLTVDQFRQRFGPTASTLATVQSALQAQGLSPGKPSANGMLIPVSATAGNLAQAFNTSFDRVQLASGRVAYANTAAPSLPQSVSAEVQGVAGLDSLTVPQSSAVARPAKSGVIVRRGASRNGHIESHALTSGPQPCSSAQNTAYTADEIANAYGFGGFYNAGDEGAGQTIALLELEPNSPSDISAYQQCYGTTTSVQYFSVAGGPGTGPGTVGEAALDIEQLIGLAPKATIDVYQGPLAVNATDGDYIDLLAGMITNPSVNVISTSWGVCEDANNNTSTVEESYLFQEAAAQGQSVYAAAGDSGSEDCDGVGGLSGSVQHELAVDDPGSQPYVTSVGGTNLKGSLSGGQIAWSQVIWNNTGVAGEQDIGAGGGGISDVWPMPSWQADTPGSLNVVNANSSSAPCGVTSGYCREVPDVSANADPYTGYAVYWTDPNSNPTCSGWCDFGGTSAAAPLWAAYTALVNASAACNGTPIGFADPLLYKAATNAYASDFTDITSGNNDYLNVYGKYPAATGYDMASGLGTMAPGVNDASPLGTTLCDESDSVTVTNPGNQSAQVGGTIAPVTVGAVDRQGHALTYTATGLPAGLSINSGTGQISGTTTTAGTSAVTVTATAPLTGATQTTPTFSWTVESTTSTYTQTTTQPAQTITRTDTDTVTQPAKTVTQPATTVTQPARTVTQTPPATTVVSTQTVPTPPVTSTVTTPTKTVTVTIPGGTPMVKTQTISVNFGNQALKLTTPVPSACTAGAATYDVSFTSATRAGKPKLKFKSIAYYLDKGVEQAKRRARRANGRRRVAHVAAYKANATSTKASGTMKLKLGSLKSGTHTLKAIVTYSEAGKTVTKTLTTKLKVC